MPSVLEMPFFFFAVVLLYHVQVVTSKNISPKIYVKSDYSFSWSKQQVEMNPCCSSSYLLALEFFSLDRQPSCCNAVFGRKCTVLHTCFTPSNQMKWLHLFQEGRSSTVEQGVRQAPYGQKGEKTKARAEPPFSAAARVTLAQLV